MCRKRGCFPKKALTVKFRGGGEVKMKMYRALENMKRLCYFLYGLWEMNSTV